MNTVNHALLPFLLDVVARVTLLLGITAAAAALCRRGSAALRHFVWALGLFAALLMPLLTVALPTWRIDVPVTEPVLATAIAASRAASAVPAAQPPVPADAPAVDGKPIAVRPDMPTPLQPHNASTHVLWPNLLLFAWAIGALLAAAQLVQGLFSATRLGRTSVALREGPAADALADAAATLHISRPIQLRLGTPMSHVTVPLTYGTIRPVVVLPAQAADWPQERLHAVLLHELAHVRRQDWLLQILFRFAAAIYWFHPLAWLAVRKARAESEAAADDIVLAAGIPAPQYAQQLLDVARIARLPRGVTLGAVAMAQTPKVEVRLRQILSMKRRRGEVGMSARSMVAAAAACILATCTALHAASRTFDAPASGPLGITETAIVDAGAPGVTLPNGASIRMTAVAGKDLGHSTSWAPDGSVTNTKMSLKLLDLDVPPAGMQERAIVVETRYASDAQPKETYAAKPEFGHDYIPFQTSDPLTFIRPVRTMLFPVDARQELRQTDSMQQTRGTQGVVTEVTYLTMPQSQKATTVLYRVAAGPWTQSINCEKTAAKVDVPTPTGTTTFWFVPHPRHLPASEMLPGNASIIVSDHLSQQITRKSANEIVANKVALINMDRMVVALDRSGTILYEAPLRTVIVGPYPHTNNAVSPDPGQDEGSMTYRCDIPYQVLPKVASFRLLVRPFEWVEFRNVQLQPKHS